MIINIATATVLKDKDIKVEADKTTIRIGIKSDEAAYIGIYFTPEQAQMIAKRIEFILQGGFVKERI